MKLTLIGHASLLVEAQDVTILMDPVLSDPHQESLFDVYPRRVVHPGRMPHYDVIVLSHRHLDHFHIPSLAQLRRTAPIFVPDDRLLLDYVGRLGFTKIHRLKESGGVRFGRTTMLPTRSENPVPEFGFLLFDDTGSMWNQVDSIVSSRTASMVRSSVGRPDFVLAAWQPMLETAAQTNRPIVLPLDRYHQILHTLRLAAPKAIAPGANGFCYTGASSWLNRVVFPVARSRFLADAGAIAPTVDLLPGDTVVVDGGEWRHEIAASAFVERRSDEVDLSFDPLTMNLSMLDANPDGIEPGLLEGTATEVVERRLPEWVNDHRGEVEALARWNVRYEITVVGPLSTRQWHVDLAAPRCEVVQGADGCASMFTAVTASALYGLHTSTRGWDYAELGGYYRHRQSIYCVHPHGVSIPRFDTLKDPLEGMFPYEHLLRRILDRELEQCGRHQVADRQAAELATS